MIFNSSDVVYYENFAGKQIPFSQRRSRYVLSSAWGIASEKWSRGGPFCYGSSKELIFSVSEVVCESSRFFAGSMEL